MTEATKATLVSVALAGLRQFEEWQDFAPEALNLATAYPQDFGLRDQVAGIAKRFDKYDAVMRFWEEAARPKLEVVAKPSLDWSGSFKRRSLGKPKDTAAVIVAEHVKAKAKAEGEGRAKIFSAESQPPAAEVGEEQPNGKEEVEEAKGLSVEAAIKKGELVLANSDVLAGAALTLETRKSLMTAMNDRHAVIGNVGGKCRVLEWIPTELDPGALVPAFQSKTDFFSRYAHRQVGWKKGEPLSVGHWWFEHPERADYRGVVFKPGAPAIISRYESGNWLNLWRGWAVVPRKGQWPLMRGHIEQIVSAGNAKLADYNLRWIAWGFQRPEERPESALVLRGKKGGGKGILLGTVRMFYGPHGLQITHPSHLTGNFNAHLWTCCFVFADECFWAGDKQGEAVLKGLITERPFMIEKKGIDAFLAVNNVKLGVSSNSDWVVPATHDERRYAVSDIDNRYAKGVASEEERNEYFGAIARELREGGAAAMLYDLLQMDLGGWHPREVPMTTGLMRQKKESLRGNFQWLEPLLQSGELPATYDDRPNWILSSVLLAYVKTFRGLEYATDESISTFLYDEMNFVPEVVSKGGNKFRVRTDGGNKRGWVFPPLAELRARWETKFGGEWRWHDPEVTEWASASKSLLDLPLGLVEG